MPFLMAGIALLAIMSSATSLVAAQSGRLWVERNAPQQAQTRKRLRNPVVRSVDGRGYRSSNSQNIQKAQQRSYGQAPVGAAPLQSGGIQRSTLPPVQNAPVDRNYGRSGFQQSDDRNGVRNGRQNEGLTQLPSGLWQSMNFEQFRDAVLKLDGTAGSPVLNNLVTRALLDPRSRPANADPETYDLLKMVVLYRMGRIRELGDFIKTIPQNMKSLPMRIFEARAFLAGGDSARACQLASSFPTGDPNLSTSILSEALMMTALCAAQNSDQQTLGLIADLARDKGIRSPLSLAVIDLLVSGIKLNLHIPAKLGVRDYYFLRLADAKAPRNLLKKAEPALLYALAFDRSIPVVLRLDAAERAASRGQIDAAGLASIYRDAVTNKSAQKDGNRSDALIRARLFDGLSRTNDPQLRAKIIDTLLGNTRGLHLSGVIGPMLAPYVAQIEPVRGLEFFAMRAVEVALLSGDMKLAERWFVFVKQGGRAAYSAAEWLPLTDLVQKGVVPSGEGMQMALRMAKARRLDGRALHRLTSILDALSYDVSIPLWNLAGKQPQPNKGALPATGVLSRLKKLSDEGRAGEVLLMSLEAAGSHSADELHLIALGDIVRSLKKAGFAKQASLFGFSALYGIWPTGNRRLH